MTIPFTFKQRLVIGVVALALIAAGSLYYHFFVFHAIKTTPTNGQTTDFLQTVTIEFNRPLDPKAADGFTISPAVEGTKVVDGKKVIFTPIDSYKLGTTYKVTLSSVLSQSGDKAPTVKLSFKPNRIRPHETPSNLQAALPYSNDHFSITYTLNQDKTLNIRITLKAILNRPSQLAEFKADLAKYKQEALDYLSKNLGDTSDDQILISPDPDRYSGEEHIDKGGGE